MIPKNSIFYFKKKKLFYKNVIVHSYIHFIFKIPTYTKKVISKKFKYLSKIRVKKYQAIIYSIVL